MEVVRSLDLQKTQDLIESTTSHNLICPRCGKRLRLPRRAETLGVLERKEDEENLIECPPPTPLKNNRENNS
jgi:uncharacterized protein with PIN domain